MAAQHFGIHFGSPHHGIVEGVRPVCAISDQVDAEEIGGRQQRE
jgi:hypothetical protein